MDTNFLRQALCDIDVDDGKYPEDTQAPSAQPKEDAASAPPAETQASAEQMTTAEPSTTPVPRSKHASLATPAVRGLLKEFNVNILDITGTGKDGRVMKEDVHRYVAVRDAPAAQQPAETAMAAVTRPIVNVDTQQKETPTSLTPVQSGMFKSMTKSLNIPHFLYADELNVGTLSAFRKKLSCHPKSAQKLSFLPFIIKAVSLSLDQYPLLNAKVDTTGDPSGKPQIIMRSNHNIGVAMDTPQGLLVPNIKNVGARSVLDIAEELKRLGDLAKAGKLGPTDLTGGTITVSNIGNIGGTYVAPVIVQNEVAILGVGKSRRVPTYDAEGQVVPAELVNFSWSADHRVIDGATMARMADKVREYVESPEIMVLNLR
jgi:2-oxoisovalerate dehydrogenase E2 component (dihydrolipoyl transacylase)